MIAATIIAWLFVIFIFLEIILYMGTLQFMSYLECSGAVANPSDHWNCLNIFIKK